MDQISLKCFPFNLKKISNAWLLSPIKTDYKYQIRKAS